MTGAVLSKTSETSVTLTKLFEVVTFFSSPIGNYQYVPCHRFNSCWVIAKTLKYAEGHIRRETKAKQTRRPW